MPPKPKYTKEEIVRAAYEMARENGIDSVVAREVGKRLGTSASPIFTVFNSMEELKIEAKNMARDLFQEYMDGVFDYDPAFKEFGMRWVRFAKEEPHLYRLLFLRNLSGEGIYEQFKKLFGEFLTRMNREIESCFQVSAVDAAEIMNQMLIHANGIASFCITGVADFSEEMTSKSLSEACLGLVIGAKILDGTFNQEVARAQLLGVQDGSLPVKRN